MADSRLNPLYLGKEEIMIAIGCDQGGFALKQEIMAYLDKKGYKYKDFGSYSEASVDYPEYARKVQQSMMEPATRVFLSAEQE